jgi:hypothetical protein
MSALRFLVGCVCELLTLDDPYDEPHRPPEILGTYTDDHGYPVVKVRADNYIDATDIWAGTTYPGDVSKVATKTSPKTWFIHVEEWQTGPSDKHMGDDFTTWLEKNGIPK